MIRVNKQDIQGLASYLQKAYVCSISAGLMGNRAKCCIFNLGSVHNSSVRKILSAKARLQGEKRSKVGHLASIFNAAGAFLSQKIAA